MNQWFEPEPTLKGLAFAKSLVSRGHEVEVLTGFPNYPGGRLYPGYRVRLRKRESMDGIPITRVALYPSHDSSVIGRIANYSSFALTASTVGMWSVRRPDVAYVYSPPVTTALSALLLRAIRGVPFVLDVQDLWPDTLAATGMVASPSIFRAVALGCQVAYQRAAKITVLSPGLRQALIDRGIPQDKIEVIYNWCHDVAITEQERQSSPILEEAGVKNKFNVVFAGNMGRAQGLSAVLHAARQIAARVPHVQFVFVGGGIDVARLKTEALEMALPNVKFLPPRPAADVEPLLMAADVLLVHLRNDPLFSTTIPSKTQTYMASGRPILMAVRGDAAELIKAAGAGICVDPESPDTLANAIYELSRLSPDRLSSYGENGQAYYFNNLSLERGTARFETVFRDVIAAATA